MKKKKMCKTELQKDAEIIDSILQALIKKLGKTKHPADAAEFCIFEIVNSVADNFYEAIGIFEAAKQCYREIMLEVIENEKEGDLD